MRERKMKPINLFNNMKALKKRTKIEVIGMILLMIAISFSSVFGYDGSDQNIKYIRNGNGHYWMVANATNLQESLIEGGVTYFPETTIYTNKTITMPSHASLIGTGINSILKADIGLNATSSLITNVNQTHGNDNIEVRNLVLDGSNYTHSIGNPYSNYGLYWKKVSYGIVDMVWVKDTGKDGIRLETCSYCSATHINAYSTGHHSIMFCYGTTYSSMSDLIVTDSFTESAIVEWPNANTGELNHHITVSNVIAKNDGQYGVFVRDAYAVTVTGCITEQSYAEGFYVGNCYDVTLTNCITSNNLINAGFIIRDNANGVILSNCISRKAGSGNSMGYELQGKNIQVSNCVVCDTRIPFYFNSTTSKNITISLCSIRNYKNSSVLKGDNIRILENKFNTSTATPYVLEINNAATNIQVIGNDFKYAPITSRKINDASGKAVIRDNIGFPTDTFVKSGYTVSIGKNNAYSTALGLSTYARRIIAPKLRLNVSGTFNSSEIITIKVEAVYYNGVTRSIEKKYTSKSDYCFTDTDWLALAGISSTPDQSLVQINVYAKTNKSTTSASVLAYFLCSS